MEDQAVYRTDNQIEQEPRQAVELTRSEIYLIERIRQLNNCRRNGILVVEYGERLRWRVAGKCEG